MAANRSTAIGREQTDANPVVQTAQARRGFGSTLLNLGYTYSIVWILLIEILVFSLLRPDSFFTTANAQSILGSQAVLLIAALGLTVPLAAGEFDLSVVSVLALAEVITATLTTNQNWPVIPAAVVAILCSAGVGVLNAVLVVRVGLNGFIVTLGVSTLVAGISSKITSTGTVSGVPRSLTVFATTKFLGLEAVFWYGLIGAIILWYILAQTPLGRWLYFTGANQEAARLNGVPVTAIRSGAFVTSAAMAGIAGVFYTGVYGTADATSAANLLLPAFAAAFLGATAFTPGQFNSWGTFLSVYLVITGIVGLSLVTGAAGWVPLVFNGAVLVVAVTAQRVVATRRAASRTS